MLYREHKPAAPLNTVVDTLWYCHAPEIPAGRQRVLPKGSVQIVFNLSGKALHGFFEDSPASRFLLPPAIITGPSMRYGWVDTRDMCEVAGVVFRSGGAAALLRENICGLTGSHALSDLLPTASIVDALHAAPTPKDCLLRLEQWLLNMLLRMAATPVPAVQRALYLLQGHSVRDTAAHLGCSERYLRALFTPQVGLSPKAWHRLQRFRHAANRLHRGDEIRWEALALQCGYYDQAHFANEFRTFSGIDPTTYSRAERPWASHITE